MKMVFTVRVWYLPRRSSDYGYQVWLLIHDVINQMLNVKVVTTNLWYLPNSRVVFIMRLLFEKTGGRIFRFCFVLTEFFQLKMI